METPEQRPWSDHSALLGDREVAETPIFGSKRIARKVMPLRMADALDLGGVPDSSPFAALLSPRAATLRAGNFEEEQEAAVESLSDGEKKEDYETQTTYSSSDHLGPLFFPQRHLSLDDITDAETFRAGYHSWRHRPAAASEKARIDNISGLKVRKEDRVPLSKARGRLNTDPTAALQVFSRFPLSNPSRFSDALFQPVYCILTHFYSIF
jgi:hypothetical protein